jgi:hypothetical protein
MTLAWLSFTLHLPDSRIDLFSNSFFYRLFLFGRFSQNCISTLRFYLERSPNFVVF